MKRRLLLFAVVPSLLGPAGPARAMPQDKAVGARVGTLGFGADVVVPVHDHVAVRGGIGLLGFDIDLTGRFGLDDNRTATLTLPKAFYTLGAEVRLGSLRVEAGILLKSGEPSYLVALGRGAHIEIGDTLYHQTDVNTLTTTLSSGAASPYVLLGFGWMVSSAFSFGADIGVAMPAGVELTMAATGNEAVVESASFRDDLALKVNDSNDQAGGFVRFWPIVSIGVRYGLSPGRG